MVKAPLEQLQSARSRTLAMMQGLSQAQMDYSPAPDEWSVGEVVDHLILSENFLRRDIAELIALAKAGRKPVLYRSSADFNVTLFFIPKFMLPFLEVPLNFLNMFIPYSVREFLLRSGLIPAQAADITIPRKGRSTAELYEALQLSLQETEALFAANPSLDYDKMMHQHPLFGAQNVLQLLHTLGLHEQGHQDQISNILATPRFPKAA